MSTRLQSVREQDILRIHKYTNGQGDTYDGVALVQTIKDVVERAVVIDKSKGRVLLRELRRESDDNIYEKRVLFFVIHWHIIDFFMCLFPKQDV